MEKNPKDNSGEQDEGPFIRHSKKRKISLPKIKAFAVFKNPVFRIYYGAIFAQRAAMNMQMITRSLLIYRLTGSAALLGATALAHSLPSLLTALFGGALADRVQKKYLLLIGQVASTLVFMGIAISLTTGYLNSDSWWILMCATAISGVFQGITMPSRQSIIPEIVGDQSIMNAIALNNLSMSLMRFVAPALAGFLIDAWDFHVVYYLMATMSIISVILIALLPLTGKAVTSSTKMLKSIIEGFQYIWRNRIIVLLLAVMLLAVLLSRPLQQLMPIFTEDIFKVSALKMGILLSIGGVGATIGSLILASLPNKKRGLILLSAYLISGVTIVVFSFSTSYYLAIALMILIGMAQAIRMTLSNSLLMQNTEDKYRGRVMSIHEMEFAITSLGTFGAALLAEVVGVQWAIGGFAIALIFVAALSTVFVPRIRKLD